MAIVGFSFTKIDAQKKSGAKGKVNISNNVSLSNVEDAKLTMAKEKQSLRVSFAFETKYEPSLALIRLEGDILMLEEKKRGDEILKHWSTSQALPKELMQSVLNHILDRCNVEALILARDLGLPAPVPLPKVDFKGAQPAAKKATKTAKKTKK